MEQGIRAEARSLQRGRGGGREGLEGRRRQDSRASFQTWDAAAFQGP